MTPLRKTREHAGVKPSVVADQSGVDRGFYLRIEAGAPCSAATARKIATFFREQGHSIDEREILYPADYAALTNG